MTNDFLSYFGKYTSFFLSTSHCKSKTTQRIRNTPRSNGHSKWRPLSLLNDLAHEALPSWQRFRAISVRKLWKLLTVLASTTYCGKLLYMSTIKKIDLEKSAECWSASTQCPYNCLLWPKPRAVSKRCEYHGSKLSKLRWQSPSTRFCNKPRIAILRLREEGAKLWSRNASFSDTPSLCKKMLCTWSILSSREGAAWKYPPEWTSTKPQIWIFVLMD